MERAARRFAGWVLGLHFMVLALLVVIVFFASREVYTSARRQALDQVKVRQEMLAAQSARGIEGFYRSLVDSLATAQRAQDMKLDITPLVWEQLRGQARDLLSCDRRTGAVSILRSDAAREWSGPVKQRLAESVSGSGVVAVGILRSADSADEVETTVSAAAGDRALVAIVPVRSIESRFLNDLNQPENISATLLDGDRRVVSAERRALIGADVAGPEMDPRIRELAGDDIRRGERVTREFLGRMRFGDVDLEPAMVTAQPVDLPDGNRWWLIVSSNLSEVDAIVSQFFRRAIIGGGLVILAMTGILVSTSAQMIRGRLRLERLRHDMLTRELDQAREIQLAWLPERQEVQIATDVAAVNRPASHVSGDFYNWFELSDGRSVLVIGDVTGHGLPAAFLMATTQLLVRLTIDRLRDPGATLREVNRQLCRHVFSGQFVTMLIMVLDPVRGSVEVATAGHPPPLVGCGDDFAALAVEPQLVLAIDNDVDYRTQRFDLSPGCSLLLYTDGVTDLQAPGGERLGIEGLQKTLYGRFDSARALVDAAVDAVEAFRAGRESADDLTLVAVQFPAPVTPTPPPAEPATPAATGPLAPA